MIKVPINLFHLFIYLKKILSLVYVTVNEETNQLTSIKLNREHPIFDKIAVPQIQIRLLLKCPNLPTFSLNSSRINDLSKTASNLANSREVNPEYDDGRYFVLTDDIYHEDLVTHLNIIIEDENDNYPIFSDFYNNTVLGYPGGELAEHILPPHLIQVHATDLDFGLNAKIKYSLDENDHFDINYMNGVISPKRNAMQRIDEVRIIVHAIDRFGADDGLRTSIIITVKRLDANHLTELTVKKASLNDPHWILDIVNEQDDFYLFALQWAFVSVSKDARSIRENNENRPILKLIVYGVDKNGELLEGSYVQRYLPFFQL